MEINIEDVFGDLEFVMKKKIREDVMIVGNVLSE